MIKYYIFTGLDFNNPFKFALIMINRKIVETLKLIIDRLKVNYKYVSGVSAPYYYQELNFLRDAIFTIKNLGLFERLINEIEKTAIFSSNSNDISVSTSESSQFDNLIRELYFKSLGIIEASKDYDQNDTSTALIFKYRQISNFSDLEKLSKDLKQSLEIPIQSLNANEDNLDILSIEEGSIVLTVSFGTAGIFLASKLIDLAYKYKSKLEEGKRQAEYTKTLELENNLKETFVNAIDAQVKTFLQVQTEALVKEEIGDVENEKIELIKNSIITLNSLLNRGLIVQPSYNAPAEIKHQFEEINILDNVVQKQIASTSE